MAYSHILLGEYVGWHGAGKGGHRYLFAKYFKISLVVGGGISQLYHNFAKSLKIFLAMGGRGGWH